MRLELDRLPPLLRPFDDERDLAVVLRPPLDEPLPFDERLRLEAERLRELDAELFDRPEDEPLLRELPLLRLRELELPLRDRDVERFFFTSPSSIVPRQEPLSSSSIVT